MAAEYKVVDNFNKLQAKAKKNGLRFDYREDCFIIEKKYSTLLKTKTLTSVEGFLKGWEDAGEFIKSLNGGE